MIKPSTLAEMWDAIDLPARWIWSWTQLCKWKNTLWSATTARCQKDPKGLIQNAVHLMHLHFHVERLQMSYVQNLMFNYNYEYDVHKVTTRKNRRSIYIYIIIYIYYVIYQSIHTCVRCVYIYVVATASMSAKVVASVYISDQSQLTGTFSDSRAMEWKCPFVVARRPVGRNQEVHTWPASNLDW